MRYLVLTLVAGALLAARPASAKPSDGKLGRFGLEVWVKACAQSPKKVYTTPTAALQEHARLWAVYFERTKRKEKPNPKPKTTRTEMRDKSDALHAATRDEFPNPFLEIFLDHFDSQYTWNRNACYTDWGGGEKCRAEADFWAEYDSRYSQAISEVRRECELARRLLDELDAKEAEEKRLAEEQRRLAEEQQRAEEQRREQERLERAAEHDRRAAEMREAEEAARRAEAAAGTGDEGPQETITLSSSGSSKAGNAGDEGKDEAAAGSGEGAAGETSAEDDGDGSAKEGEAGAGGGWVYTGGGESSSASGNGTARGGGGDKGDDGGGGAGAAQAGGALGQVASMAVTIGAIVGATYIFVKLSELGGAVSFNLRGSYGFGQENQASVLLDSDCPAALSCGASGLAGGAATMSLMVGDWFVVGGELGLGWSADPDATVTVTSLHPESATRYGAPVTTSHALGGGSYLLFGGSVGVGHVDSWLVRGGINFGSEYDGISHRDIYGSLRYALTDSLAIDLRATFLWEDSYSVDFGDRVECDVVGTGGVCLESMHTIQMAGRNADDLQDAGLVKYPFTVGIGLELGRSQRKKGR